MDSTLTTLDHERNRIGCDRCGDPLGTTEGQDRIIRVGDYNADTQTWDRSSETQLCWPCWSEREGRKAGVPWRPDSVEAVYGLLAAADGDIAAVLTWWTKRPTVRVVDGEPQAARTRTKRDGSESDGSPRIRFEAERIEGFDREEFDDVADPPEEMGVVRLLEVEETVFEELEGDG